MKTLKQPCDKAGGRDPADWAGEVDTFVGAVDPDKELSGTDRLQEMMVLTEKKMALTEEKRLEKCEKRSF